MALHLEMTDHQSRLLRGYADNVSTIDFSDLPPLKVPQPLFIPVGHDKTLKNLRIERQVGYIGNLLVHQTTYKGYIGRADRLPLYGSRIPIVAITDREQPTVECDGVHAGATEAAYLLVDPDVRNVNADAVASGVPWFTCCEVVWATIAAGTPGVVTFTRPKTDYCDGTVGLTRLYGANSYLVPITVSRNVTFDGGYIMGKDADGAYGASTASVSNANLVGIDGWNFVNGFRTEGNTYDGIAAILYRDLYFDATIARDSNAGGDAGKGYWSAAYVGAGFWMNNCQVADGQRNTGYTSYSSADKVVQYCRFTDLQDGYTTLNGGHGIGQHLRAKLNYNQFAGSSVGGAGCGSVIHGDGDTDVEIIGNKLNGGEIHLHMDCDNVLIQDNDGSSYEAPNSGAFTGPVILVASTDRTAGSGAIAGAVPPGPTSPANIKIVGNRLERIYTSGGFLPGGDVRWGGYLHILDNVIDNAADPAGRPVELQTKDSGATLKMAGNTITHRGDFSAVLINGNGVSVAAEYGAMEVDSVAYGPNSIEHTDGGNTSNGITLAGTGTIAGTGANSMTGGSGSVAVPTGGWTVEVEEAA